MINQETCSQLFARTTLIYRRNGITVVCSQLLNTTSFKKKCGGPRQNDRNKTLNENTNLLFVCASLYYVPSFVA